VEGLGDIRYAQMMTFTTLMLFQIINVFCARSIVTLVAVTGCRRTTPLERDEARLQEA